MKLSYTTPVLGLVRRDKSAVDVSDLHKGLWSLGRTPSRKTRPTTLYDPKTTRGREHPELPFRFSGRCLFIATVRNNFERYIRVLCSKGQYFFSPPQPETTD